MRTILQTILLAGMFISAACGDTKGRDSVIFSNLRVEELTDTSAVIRFTTSDPTTCEVEYGSTANSLNDSATDPSMDLMSPFATDHNVPLAGLLPSTTYYYRARAEDREGNIFLSEVSTFNTLEDSTPTNMTNIAMASAGTAVFEVSSNFGDMGNASTWGVNNAIDGDLGTEWATGGDGDAAYVILDLGQTRTISRLRFQSRRMTDGSSIITRLRLLWSNNTMTAGPFDTPDPLQLYSFDLDPAISTDRIRIEAVATTGGNTGAKEIQLMELNP